jgi:hypothetical protein
MECGCKRKKIEEDWVWAHYKEKIRHCYSISFGD